jgi:hypothetical protein
MVYDFNAIILVHFNCPEVIHFCSKVETIYSDHDHTLRVHKISNAGINRKKYIFSYMCISIDIYILKAIPKEPNAIANAKYGI